MLLKTKHCPFSQAGRRRFDPGLPLQLFNRLPLPYSQGLLQNAPFHKLHDRKGPFELVHGRFAPCHRSRPSVRGPVIPFDQFLIDRNKGRKIRAARSAFSLGGPLLTREALVVLK